MTFEQAVELLKKTVKYSCIEGQKHLDLGLVMAGQRDQYQKALVVVRKAIAAGEKSEDEFKQLVGLE
jgi:hypothetical protein